MTTVEFHNFQRNGMQLRTYSHSFDFSQSDAFGIGSFVSRQKNIDRLDQANKNEHPLWPAEMIKEF